ncbi:GAF and ANTAR domain-containing protein [Pengzhenrongella sicca]|uniref:GAF and ANTAR domain-containing protein n=1 Tax=Pengzhenrongella sicca TaxID=2819238 RepID=A0A8A4ZGJ1_9MICO|nr:GAF and ANTAR domain-containing protein [Pengzhenrongella sicca]QTE30395.1 GAF and ANTAR domain-containing protein [Pengzhenrongella sicca]
MTDETAFPHPRPESPGPAPEAGESGSSALGSLLLETASIEAYLEDFTSRAASYLGAGTQCGITLRHLGRDRRAASSDERAARCDDVEVATGAGPCLTAMDERRTLTTREIWRDDRWIAWRDAAELEGFRSAAAVPASAGGGTEIALNLYSEQADPWDPERLVRAAMFADQIAQVMALCIRIAEQTVINADLTAAMASRSTIDQAIGIIMAQNRCSAEDAFAILRRASSHRNVKLRVVAAAVVQGITGVAPAAGQFRPRHEN